MGPGLDLFRPGGEVALQSEQVVRFARKCRESRFGQAHRLEHFVAIGVVEFGKLAFELRAHRHHRAALLGRAGANPLDEFAFAKHVVFINVADVQHLLGRDQAESLERLAFVFASEFDRPCRLALGKCGLASLEHGDAQFGILVARARGPLRLVESRLHLLKVGDHQLGVDGLDVADRVDVAVDVGDVVVFETTHHVYHGINLPNVRQELVPQPLALAGTTHQPGDVDQPQNGGHDFVGRNVIFDRLEPRIGNLHNADVRLDGAERVVLAGDACRR